MQSAEISEEDQQGMMALAEYILQGDRLPINLVQREFWCLRALWDHLSAPWLIKRE
jgi:hypothetical protein